MCSKWPKRAQQTSAHKCKPYHSFLPLSCFSHRHCFVLASGEHPPTATALVLIRTPNVCPLPLGTSHHQFSGMPRRRCSSSWNPRLLHGRRRLLCSSMTLPRGLLNVRPPWPPLVVAICIAAPRRVSTPRRLPLQTPCLVVSLPHGAPTGIGDPRGRGKIFSR